MKKLTMIILLAAFSITGYAQQFMNLGLKAGINTSKLSVDDDDYNPQTINNYLFGAFARFNLGPIYLQPEAYYNSKGGEYFNRENPPTVSSFNLNTIDVPALVGLKLIDQDPLNVRIMAGPVFSFMTKKSAKGQLTEDNIRNSFFAYQFGAGVDFLFLTLDARFEKYGRDIEDLPTIDTKGGNFVVSLGIKLF
ncbi:MAG TPA: porin family protein [Prolixibacteraceae bacterium]|nr:porin family protein [Prolixibacteraceae bacterium]